MGAGVLKTYSDLLAGHRSYAHDHAGRGRHAAGQVQQAGYGAGPARSFTSSWRAATPPAPSKTGAWWLPSPRPWRKAAEPSCAPLPATPAPPLPPSALTAACPPWSSSPGAKWPWASWPRPWPTAQRSSWSTATSIRPSNWSAPSPPSTRSLVNSVNPYRLEGQKTGGLRDCGRSGRRAGLSVHPGGQRRQHHRLLAGIPGVLRAGAQQDTAEDDGIPGGGGGSHRARRAGRQPPDYRLRHPHRQPGQLEGSAGGPRPAPAAR